MCSPSHIAAASSSSSAPIRSIKYDKSTGRPADLLHWPSAEPNPTIILVFIPGNPGLVEYYTPFLGTIHERLGPRTTEIYALGHLDHTSHAKPRLTARGVTTLQQQIDHKIAFIDELCTKTPTLGVGKHDTQLTLISHSIGSYISVQCLKQRPLRVSRAVLLFPTISHMAATPNGKRLSPLFSSLMFTPVGISTSFLSYLPTSALSRVVGKFAGQSGPGVDVTTNLVQSPGTVISALSMAQEELRDVTELDKGPLTEYGARLRFYWARGDDDGWVLQSSREEIERTLDEARHPKEHRRICEEGMQHAFILTSSKCSSLYKALELDLPMLKHCITSLQSMPTPWQSAAQIGSHNLKVNPSWY